ncbi:hypothetical protein BDF20DRAFT_801674, partial [Mycotypha africana]|uniref:uncharacterized protein n=1 Tax=Mycotypha africana TaxID=64632 RepID=UPI00230080C7
DAQSLFQLFSPSLHFEIPKKSTRQGWFVLAEQFVPTSKNAFWQTIRRWTFEPQLVIPPIDKADVEENMLSQSHEHCSSTESPVESFTRRLYPKRKSKDPVLEETVEYYETSRESRVVYLPKPPEEMKLPFYYPK